MPRDHAGWAWSTLAEQELGWGVHDTVGFETAKLQCHQPCPLHAWGQHHFPVAEVLLTGHLLSTVLLGQAGQGGDSSDHKCLGETLAWQEGGGSCQEDKDKVAVRLKAQTQRCRAASRACLRGTEGSLGRQEL